MHREPTMASPVVRVLVAAEIRFYREGLAEVLQRSPRLRVVGTAADREEILARVGESRPDVVLLDAAMPASLETVISITSRAPDSSVVVIGVRESESDVLEWAEAGVAGYVPRDASLEELTATVERTTRGELRCSPRVAASLLRRVGTLATLAGDRGPTAVSLTQREREIVELIDRGMSNKDIARHLGIEVATAKNHVHHILEKLHVHHRAEAAAWLRRRGVRIAPTGPLPPGGGDRPLSPVPGV